MMKRRIQFIGNSRVEKEYWRLIFYCGWGHSPEKYLVRVSYSQSQINIYFIEADLVEWTI